MKSGNTKMVRHPYTDAKITLAQFFEEFGGKHEKQWAGKTRPAPLCFACRCPMATKGDDRPIHTITIAHWPKDKRPCPLRNQANEKYELLDDGYVNPARGVALRARFMQDWWHHFNVINSFVDYVYDIKDFIAMIELADDKKLWQRARLELWEIPFIFMVWRAFEPVKNHTTGRYLRDYWIRFWLDATCKSINDLWIRATQQMKIVRAEYYRPLRKNFPGESELIGDPVEIEIHPWQPSANTARLPNPYQINLYSRRFHEAVVPN